MTSGTPSVSVSLDIAAPASELFALLARPSHHTSVDGTNMLRGTDDERTLSKVGDVFEMRMFNDEMGDYVMENHIVEFEPDHRIVWEPTLKKIDKADMQDDVGESAHHQWGWELTPLSDGATRVTEFFDCSASPEWLRKATRDGEQWRPGMEASLARLAALVAPQPA